MKCKILHECRLNGMQRMRVHLCCGRMTLSDADVLEYYLRSLQPVKEVKVYDRTCDAVILYEGSERELLLAAFASFQFATAAQLDLVPEHTSRALNREFEDKLVFTVAKRCVSKLLFPVPLRTGIAIWRSVGYIKKGLASLLHGKLTVEVLDATAITVSMLQGNVNTASSVMFMPCR